MPAASKRIDIIDAVRGVAILSMVVYHGLYDVYDIFGYQIGIFNVLKVLEPPFAGAFILLAGLSCRFSHNNVLRGVRVFLFGMAVTAVTVLFMPSEAIYFGILHFMGAAILLFVLVRRGVDRIPVPIALPLWAALFILTYAMPSAYWIGIPGLFGFQLPLGLLSVPNLYPLGLPDLNFFSADYFPMVPWFFLFLIGTIAGVPVRAGRLPEKFYTARVPFFAAAGRRTLLIYVLHQPVIFGILFLCFRVIRQPRTPEPAEKGLVPALLNWHFVTKRCKMKKGKPLPV